ncbi:hypothetical protein FQN52_008122 [Onygenales sp. PD_12]|nr:hypothetical protein FQN52_008122 [Onygenales sp. PD_12]
MSTIDPSSPESAWSKLRHLHCVVFNDYAGLQTRGINSSQELINMTMNLLKFNGMAHADIIFCKHIVRLIIFSLAPAITVFDNGVAAAAKLPILIMPFTKLIEGDHSNLLLCKDMEPLVALIPRRQNPPES